MARGSISTECAESATVKVEMIKVEEERGRLVPRLLAVRQANTD